MDQRALILSRVHRFVESILVLRRHRTRMRVNMRRERCLAMPCNMRCHQDLCDRDQRIIKMDPNMLRTVTKIIINPSSNTLTRICRSRSTLSTIHKIHSRLITIKKNRNTPSTISMIRKLLPHHYKRKPLPETKQVYCHSPNYSIDFRHDIYRTKFSKFKIDIDSFSSTCRSIIQSN